ncbi:MAG: alpha/beta hydrolase [Rhizomicrobium sp.]
MTTQRDIPFADAGNRPLTLDVYRPAGTANGAAVLMLHGGAWARGSKAMLVPHATALAAQGFVVLTSEYRLTGEARFPAQIHDVKRALRWSRARASELGFDPDKLCLEGHSAGGQLALLAAGSGDDPRLDPPEGAGGVSARVAAVAAIYPPVLFYVGDERPSGGIPAAALPGAEISAETAALASPLGHVGPGLPPVMLLHGDADRIVPVSTSLAYAGRVREAGGKVDLHLFAGFPHGFANHPRMVSEVMAMIGGFFRRTVVEPQAYVFGRSRFEAAAGQG